MEADSLLVTAIIMADAICAECIASKVGLTVSRVDEVLIHIRNTLTLSSRVATCTSCLKQTVVHRLE
jgi:hypothetical protein